MFTVLKFGSVINVGTLSERKTEENYYMNDTYEKT